MTTHIVQRGESLSVIARKYQINFWANIYLARENQDFRFKRANPHVIQPGDEIFIPNKASISRLEVRPTVNHKLPKLFTQPTLDLCWQACAQMLFCWKHRTPTAETDFRKKLGNDFGKPGGLKMESSKKVLGKLGMNWALVSSINELHEILLLRGPLWVAEINGNAHAQILTGYNLNTCQWYLLDPLGKGMRISFDTSGGATGGAMGAATLANMSRSRDINSMALDNLVFGYR